MEDLWITVVSLSRVVLDSLEIAFILTSTDTVLLWEDVRDTDNKYMFPTQHKNLTKVCSLCNISDYSNETDIVDRM